MSTANTNTIREAAKVGVPSTYGPEGKSGWRPKKPEVREESLRTKVLNVLMSCCKARTADKKPSALTAGAAGRTARKAAAAVLASCARIVAMTAFCVALVAVPAGCSIVTGFAPVECGKGCFDV